MLDKVLSGLQRLSLFGALWRPGAPGEPPQKPFTVDAEGRLRVAAVVENPVINLSDPTEITGVLPVTNGGTGRDALAAGAFVTGNGASAVALVGPGSAGQFPVSSSGGIPVLRALGGDATLDETGALTIANGAVTPAKMANVDALSILGRNATTSGVLTQIIGSVAGQVFKVNEFGTGLETGPVVLTNSNAVSGALPVGNGGTGQSSLTAGAFVTGNGTSAVVLVGPGSAGQVPVSSGTAPVMRSVSGDATLDETGALTIANGAVTPAKIANQAAYTFLLNNTSGIAAPTAVAVDSLVQKTSVTGLDKLILSDSAASNALKYVTWQDKIKNTICGINDFRLTLTSGTPVTTSDVTAATTIYMTPYTGNRIALFDGTRWVLRNTAQISLGLGTLTTLRPHDVFVYDNAGTPALEFSTAWTSDTVRATALTTQDGVLVKSGATTRRYIGTFRTTSTTQTEDSNKKRFLWNYYNRTARRLQNSDTTAHASVAGTWQEWRAPGTALTYAIQFVCGWYEEDIFVSMHTGITENIAAGGGGNIAIAFDRTNNPDSPPAYVLLGPGYSINGLQTQHVAGGLGYHYFAPVEQGAATADTFIGFHLAGMMRG